jgi:hypothetical protein
MKHAFNWKKPLFYALLPIFILLAFVGFPPPFAPPGVMKARQEQSAPAEEASRSHRS